MEWGKTDKELVQSWLAFKDLYRRKLILFSIPTYYKPNQKPEDYGWKDKWDVCSDEYFMNRALTTPEDFILAHDVFGADVMTPGNYHCVNPRDLPSMLAKHLDIPEIEMLFPAEEVAKEVKRYPLARYKRTR